MKKRIDFEYAILVSARFDHCPIYISWDVLETPILKPFIFEISIVITNIFKKIFNNGGRR